MTLFDGLLDDAAIPAGRSVDGALTAFRALGSPGSSVLSVRGLLVVPDTALAAVARSVGDGPPVPVQVVASGGAGGLLPLARRDFPGLELAAAVTTLRDLDDLAGNAARVVAAAEEVPDSVTVYVGLPYAPGWERAVEVVEAAGLSGAITRGPARATADQLSALIEADLPFTVTGGVGDAAQVLGLLSAVDALVDGASPDEAAQLLDDTDIGRLATAVVGWEPAAAVRVRRRLRSISCLDLTSTAGALERLGLP